MSIEYFYVLRVQKIVIVLFTLINIKSVCSYLKKVEMLHCILRIRVIKFFCYDGYTILFLSTSNPITIMHRAKSGFVGSAYFGGHLMLCPIVTHEER